MKEKSNMDIAAKLSIIKTHIHCWNCCVFVCAEYFIIFEMQNVKATKMIKDHSNIEKRIANGAEILISNYWKYI